MKGYDCNLQADEACDRIANYLEENPGAWLRGAYARDTRGHCCAPESPDAIRFCSLGLVMKFIRSRAVGHHIALLLSQAVSSPGTMESISAVRFNDEIARDVTDVIAMFRCAAHIARLPREAHGLRASYREYVRPLPSGESPPKAPPDWYEFLSLSPTLINFQPDVLAVDEAEAAAA